MHRFPPLIILQISGRRFNNKRLRKNYAAGAGDIGPDVAAGIIGKVCQAESFARFDYLVIVNPVYTSVIYRRNCYAFGVIV